MTFVVLAELIGPGSLPSPGMPVTMSAASSMIASSTTFLKRKVTFGDLHGEAHGLSRVVLQHHRRGRWRAGRNLTPTCRVTSADFDEVCLVARYEVAESSLDEYGEELHTETKSYQKR